MIDRLSRGKKLNSFFEVGCGCGANLYLLLNDGYKIGGMDYSSALIEIAKKVFKKTSTNVLQELFCDEAINLKYDIRYDSVFSNSVFSYFLDEKYATAVLDKMLLKSKYSLGLLDVHNIEKKNDFEAYRRKNIENYDVKYRDLKKLFYHKEFFYEWAKVNDCEIEFYDSYIAGYWNNEFVFDVYFFKKEAEDI